MGKEVIPEELYRQLVELMGKKKADEFIERENYNFKSISLQIYYLQIKRYVKKHPLVIVIVLVAITICLFKYFTDFQSW